MTKPFSQNASIRDREQNKFGGDSLDATSVRVVSGWTPDVALSYFVNALHLEGFRYFTQSEDADFVYTVYYNANDEFISGYKVSKTTKRADIYYPYLLKQDGDKLLTQNDEALLL